MLASTIIFLKDTSVLKREGWSFIASRVVCILAPFDLHQQSTILRLPGKYGMDMEAYTDLQLFSCYCEVYKN